MRKTKIIATIGPASSSPKKIAELIEVGVDIFRINMSHISADKEANDIVETIRNAEDSLSKRVGILFDLCGPKIRVTNNISKRIVISKDKEYTLGRDNVDIPLGINIKFNDVNKDAYVKIDDGKIIFKVLSKVNDYCLSLRALSDGEIQSAKGVNFPGINLDLPSVTQKDIEDLHTAISAGVDWVALSFVRNASDRNILDSILEKSDAQIKLLAKIEKPEAIQNLKSIIDAFDGILVARGDLGVEMPLEQVPILQKRIIATCNKKGKPVITATQMLESMVDNPTPTRAEVGDIASAIYDGTDAIMLSGEHSQWNLFRQWHQLLQTLKGKYLELLKISKGTFLS